MQRHLATEQLFIATKSGNSANLRFDIERGPGSSLHRPANLQNLHRSKYKRGLVIVPNYGHLKRFFVKSKCCPPGGLAVI